MMKCHGGKEVSMKSITEPSPIFIPPNPTQTGPVVNREKRVLKHSREASERITFLANAMYYFLRSVFIVSFNDHYRLVVLHGDYMLSIKKYSTLRGAKVGFGKLYSMYAYKQGVKPQWTHFYSPDKDWLDEILDHPTLQSH
jgi:hypothetical protein